MSSSEETKAPPDKASEDWAMLPWRKLERHVYRLQKRIYRASERGNVPAVHRLQQLLMRSRSAQLLAVRRVTQDNRGKKTAGIDGVKSLGPPARLALVAALHPTHIKRTKARPVRRVWIPKPGKPEKRPLGIPVLRDRAHQALVKQKQAVEPEWEARFERHSYGFRPGRGCHDAIEAIFGVIKQKPKYVLDADIAQCFDRISHHALLNKLATYPALRQTIRAWLKAGVMDAGVFTPIEEGTPQGGVISPLLANIALHGMEAAIQDAYTVREGKPTLIHYADDFVILHSTHAGIEKAKDVIEPWLQAIGLELKPSKTRIAHTLHPLQGEPGFDFLGMTIRQYPVGPAHSGRDTYGRLLGFKTLIKPSEDAIKRHVRAVGRVVRKHQTAPQAALIEHLNPVIRGWATYYRTVVAKDSYARCDDWLYSKLRHWARRRHRNKSLRWISRKYWTIGTADGWTFKAPDGSVLTRHTATPIKRHVKVQGTASPYDGNLIYWAQRLTDHPLTRSKLAHLLRRQRGRCASCGLYVTEGDVLEIDHIIPRVSQDDNRMINLHVLHRHCHDRKTAQDGSNQASVSRGIHVTDHLLEEPDEVNVSCPVL